MSSFSPRRREMVGGHGHEFELGQETEQWRNMISRDDARKQRTRVLVDVLGLNSYIMSREMEVGCLGQNPADGNRING
jgi:hypothetical protein